MIVLEVELLLVLGPSLVLKGKVLDKNFGIFEILLNQRIDFFLCDSLVDIDFQDFVSNNENQYGASLMKHRGELGLDKGV